jgi:hypothetical protein
LLGAVYARGYHLHEVPTLSRRLRVLADASLSICFRRDIAEIGMVERPRLPVNGVTHR